MTYPICYMRFLRQNGQRIEYGYTADQVRQFAEGDTTLERAKELKAFCAAEREYNEAMADTGVLQ